MKTTQATLHSDIAKATGCANTIDLTAWKFGTDFWNHCAKESVREHDFVLDEGAELPGFLSDEDRKKAADFMTMAEIANHSEPLQYIEKRELNTDAEPQEIAPMQKSYRRASRFERFLNGVLGIVLTTLVICMLIMIFAWR